jgi:MFS family permease
MGCAVGRGVNVSTAIDGEAAMSATAARLEPSRARGVFATVVVIAAFLLAALDRHILSLLVTPIQRELGVSDSQIALLQGAAFVIVHAVATLGVGWLCDRFDRRGILVVGIALWSAMGAFCGLARSFGTLALFRGGVGLGEATVTPVGYSLAADHFPPRLRGRVTGILSASVTLGGGAALIVGGAILALIGADGITLPVLGQLPPWRAAFVLMGLGGAPVVLLAALVRDPRTERRDEAGGLAPGPTLIAHLRAHLRTFGAIYCAVACNGIPSMGALMWGPTMLARRFGTSGAEAGVLVGTALMVGGVAGAMIASTISDRWVRLGLAGGRIRGHALLFAISTVGLLWFALAPSAVLATWGFGLCLLAVNAISALHYVAMQDLATESNRAQFIGLLHFVSTLMSYTLGPSLVAGLTDYVYRSPGSLNLSIATLAVPLALAGGIVAWRARADYDRTFATVSGAGKGH